MENRTISITKQVNRIKGELVVNQPKTQNSVRILPVSQQAVDLMVEGRKKHPGNPYMFPSPKTGGMFDPDSFRHTHDKILKAIGAEHIRFHDLRHTFATASPEHGMDVKTLSTVIGHVSSSTTLNIYAHVTDEMRRTAAAKIDRGIGKAPPALGKDITPRKPSPSTFQAYKGQRRNPGTGCVSQINDHLWEGRYSPVWPDGKKHPCNIYAHSQEECEQLLAQMIAEVKSEIAAEKERLKQN